MKHSTFLTFIPTKWAILLLLSFTPTISQGQNSNFPPAGLLCISECGTCPVICSPPPAPPSPATPKPQPPPPVHHNSPPLPYYFDSPSPASSPPAHPPPSPRRTPPPAYITYGGASPPPPPPPSVYVYNPGNVAPQRNFSFPYYYFYASKASCSVPSEGFFLFGLLVFFQALYHFR